MNSKPQKLELGDFELGHIKAMFKGKSIAFTGTSLGLGIVTKDEGGYTPIPLAWFSCDSMERSMDYAHQLNEYALNISREEAWQIIGSSMNQKTNPNS